MMLAISVSFYQTFTITITDHPGEFDHIAEPNFNKYTSALTTCDRFSIAVLITHAITDAFNNNTEE
jgi:hypothetical protein